MSLIRRGVRGRVAAALATGALGVTGLVVVAAPAASAGTVDPTVTCTTPIGTSSGPMSFTVTTTPTHGDGTNVSFDVTPGQSPEESPIALPSATIATTYTFSVSNGGADVSLAAPPITGPIAANTPISVPPFTATANITGVPAGDAADLTLKNIAVVISVGGSQLATASCVPTANNGVVDTYTMDSTGGGGGAPTLTADKTAANTDDTVNLSGSNWPAGPVTVALCTTNYLVNSCDSSYAAIASNTVAVNNGTLSGAVVIGGTALPGPDNLQVTSGTTVMTVPLAVTQVAGPGARTVTMTPTSGPVGTTVQLTGAHFSPNATVNISGSYFTDVSNLFQTGDPQITVTADANGSWTASYTINDPSTAAIQAWEFETSTVGVNVPFTVTTGPAPVSQTATATLNAGSLTLTQAGTGINFGSVTMNGTAQTLTANMNEATVTDARGGNLGWTLTGTMTDLTAATGTSKIPAGNISWTPACKASATSLSTVTTGAPGALGSTPSTLCSQAPSSTSTTGGSFTADAAMTLTTPAFAAAGTYTGTLTLSLS